MAPRPAESVQLFLTQAPPGGVEVYLLKSRATADDTWEGTVQNTATGRAQAKIFAVCISRKTP